MSIQKNQKSQTFLDRFPWLPIYLLVLITLLIWGMITFSGTPPEHQQAAISQGKGAGWIVRLTAPWRHWDTPYYLNIAENWYSPGAEEITFPPMYSILVGILGRLLGGAYLPAALIVTWGSLAAACDLLNRTYQDYTDAETAKRAVKYFLLFPTAFFLFAGYTESLFLVFALLSWRGAKKDSWWQAGIFGALASMTRFVGVYLLAAYAWMWLKAPRKEKLHIAAWLAPIPLTLIGWFWLTEHLYGINPYTAGLKFWYMKTAWPWEGVINGLKYVLGGGEFFENVYIYADLLAVFIFVSAIVWAIKRSWWPEAIFMGVTMTTYLIKVLETGLLTATARYVLVLFPGFLLLGRWGKNRWFNLLWPAASFLGMLFLATFFFVGK